MSLWIESHQSLGRHRKTLRVAALLGIDRATVIGHMHILWWWAMDNVPSSGSLGDMTDQEIAEAAEWDGDASRFVSALVEAGFIDAPRAKVRRKLHDWDQYSGRLARQRANGRASNRLRQQRHRDAVKRDEQRDTTVTVTRDVTPRNGPTEHNNTLHNNTEEIQSATPSANTPKAKRPVVELDDDFVDLMVERYGRVFGGRDGVLERIEEAKAYKSYAGWTNKKVGVNKWLRGDAERVPSGNGVAHRPATRTSQDVQMDNAIVEGLRSGRIKDGEPVKLGDLLRAKQLGASHG